MLEHICHRLPERSFLWLWDPPWLCARCTGFYAAILVGVVLQIALLRWKRLHWHYAVPALALPLGEVAIEHFGLGDPGNSIRCLTALPLGFLVGIGLVMPLTSYFCKKKDLS